MPTMHTVLILGGYGFFGKRIGAALAQEPDIRVLIAGRHLDKARSAARELGLAPEQALQLDAQLPQLAAELSSHGIDTVIHTAGPFQGQGYEVARAAIAAGANYIDLADGRDFVAGIADLNDDATSRLPGAGRVCRNNRICRALSPAPARGHPKR